MLDISMLIGFAVAPHRVLSERLGLRRLAWPVLPGRDDECRKVAQPNRARMRQHTSPMWAVAGRLRWQMGAVVQLALLVLAMALATTSVMASTLDTLTFRVGDTRAEACLSWPAEQAGVGYRQMMGRAHGRPESVALRTGANSQAISNGGADGNAEVTREVIERCQRAARAQRAYCRRQISRQPRAGTSDGFGSYRCLVARSEMATACRPPSRPGHPTNGSRPGHPTKARPDESGSDAR